MGLVKCHLNLLTTNYIPRGLLHLKGLFGISKLPAKLTIKPDEAEVKEHNLKDEACPKIVKLSKNLSKR